MTRLCLVDLPDESAGITQKVPVGECAGVAIGWRAHFSRDGAQVAIRMRCPVCRSEWDEVVEGMAEVARAMGWRVGSSTP